MAFKFKADVNKDVTASLKFKPSVYADLNGLCLGQLVSVEVTTEESPKILDDGTENSYQFAGLKVPKIRFNFKNVVRAEDKDRADRFFFHVEKPIISVKNDGEKMTDKLLESLYTQMWDRIKHIHDVFKNDPNYKPIAELPDIDPTSPEEKLVDQFTKFFEAIAASFNKGKNDKPIYQGEDGKGLTCYMKLIAEYMQRRYLVFPNFIGEGFIERFKTKVPPTIELKPRETQELAAGKGSKSKEDAGSAATGYEDLPADIRDAIQ